ELLEKLKQSLEQEKIAMEKELETFATEDKKNKDNWDAKYPNQENSDMEEEADEVEEYENRLSLEHNLESKLKDVNAALEKIKNGSYGKCENCGKDIEEERLLACPEAKLCMECNK
ncbi:MAG: hypothetical protein A3F47_02265, partial [Candidatus Staskawiczbacteria bacterium RIFCSPHIGHO2_12_FULL_38_11]